jgi:hypothetical protein
MCALLSDSGDSQLAQGLDDCFQKLGRHCPLCAVEYASVSDKDGDWLRGRSETLRCFLGRPSNSDLAERLYGLLTQSGCASLRIKLAELLAILEESKRSYLARRIKEASRLLSLDLSS